MIFVFSIDEVWENISKILLIIKTNLKDVGVMTFFAMIEPIYIIGGIIIALFIIISKKPPKKPEEPKPKPKQTIFRIVKDE